MEMNFYEGIIILKEFSEEFYEELKKKDFIFGIQKWGMRKLAYPIKKYKEGCYFLLAIKGTKEMTDNFDKELIEDENVLKHAIIKQDGIDTFVHEMNIGKFDYLDRAKIENDYNFELCFEDSLHDILNDYTDYEWQEEPLDGDEVETLVGHIRNQLNLINGNITREEYLKLEEQKAKHKVYVLSQYVYGELRFECDNETLGVYDNLEKAKAVAQGYVSTDLENGFVLDEELESDKIFRLFYEEQENWDCYLEYVIKEIEVQ